MRFAQSVICLICAAAFVATPMVLQSQRTEGSIKPDDPFAPLLIYTGSWSVKADHPWNGAPVGAENRLVSRCERFSRYFACEQTVDGEVQSLLVYTVTAEKGLLHSRTINTEGLAGGRGDLRLDGNHWTYLDKPPGALKGNWSRTENYIIDPNRIRFEEYESSDEGKTWIKTNAGLEVRLTS